MFSIVAVVEVVEAVVVVFSRDEATRVSVRPSVGPSVRMSRFSFRPSRRDICRVCGLVVKVVEVVFDVIVVLTADKCVLDKGKPLW